MGIRNLGALVEGPRCVALVDGVVCNKEEADSIHQNLHYEDYGHYFKAK